MLRSAALAISLVVAAPSAAIDAAGGATSAALAVDPAATSTSEVLGLALEPLPATSAAGAPLEPSAATTAELHRGPLSVQVETSQQPGQSGWLDVGHAYIESRIFQPVLWVDRFFADERHTDPPRSRSFVRVRQEVNLTQFRKEPGFGTSFNLSLRFPWLDQRLDRLRIEAEGDARDAYAAVMQRDRYGQADLVAPPDQQFRTADAGLGFRLWETLQTFGDMGVGLLLQRPPGVFGRVRFRFVEPFGNAFLARQAISGFWRTDTLFGSSGSAELEHPLPFLRGALWRLSGTTTITERSRGFEWAGDLSLIATLFLRIGGQLGYGISGATQAPVDVDIHRIYLRLRRDVWRKWVFVELAPEYQWLWTPDVMHRVGYWDVALRLEVQFQGGASPREMLAPAPPPEPGDPPAVGALPAPPSPR